MFDVLSVWLTEPVFKRSGLLHVFAPRVPFATRTTRKVRGHRKHVYDKSRCNGCALFPRPSSQSCWFDFQATVHTAYTVTVGDNPLNLGP